MTARFLTEDPARKGGNWYGFCLNNPLNYIDSTGNEPTKSQATTFENFINDIAKIEQGKTFSETLDIVGGYNFFGALANSTSAHRYIYTKRGGWIDVVHLLGVAKKLYKELGSNQTFRDIFKTQTGVQLALQRLADESNKIEQEQMAKGGLSSAYSYEDLPSNFRGLDLLYFKGLFFSSSEIKLSTLLKIYLKVYLKPAKPTDAPNWGGMPSTEIRGQKPMATNRTFKPMFTLPVEESDK